jgi:hypothetical protein
MADHKVYVRLPESVSLPSGLPYDVQARSLDEEIEFPSPGPPTTVYIKAPDEIGPVIDQVRGRLARNEPTILWLSDTKFMTSALLVDLIAEDDPTALIIEIGDE